MTVNSNPYFNLLKVWCDKLTELQIDMPDQRLNGGIICPACHFVHGRCGDAIYPLVTLADITGDSNYLTAAKKLFTWTENNMVQQDGSVINDSMNLWKGISVFYLTGLLESLLHHKSIFDSQTYNCWCARANQLLDFLTPYIESCDTAINYSAAMCGALALAYKVFNDEKYLTYANRYAKKVIPFINEEGFIVGEPKAILEPTKKGCLPIDIGYNVEESLPSLVTYYKITGNKELLPLLLKSLNTHMDFYLNDGGIDNSFGSRSPKWTYWGSRTSDGCQSAFADMSSYDPRYAEISHRNFKLLKDCTKDGLLHGGPMYISASEPPCVHHTFCHAKTLAHLLDIGFMHNGNILLPMDIGDKVKAYKSIGSALIRQGSFRATITEYDFSYLSGNSQSTASITLLQHNVAGTIFAASMPIYNAVEPTNMQFSINGHILCTTPRIEKVVNNITYTNINDRDCIMQELACGCGYEISGYLRDDDMNALCGFKTRYSFKDDCFKAIYQSNEDAQLILPIVSKEGEDVFLNKNYLIIQRDNCKLIITTNHEIMIPSLKRNFNPVGGFQTVIASIQLAANKPCKIIIKVSD